MNLQLTTPVALKTMAVGAQVHRAEESVARHAHLAESRRDVLLLTVGEVAVDHVKACRLDLDVNLLVATEASLVNVYMLGVGEL